MGSAELSPMVYSCWRGMWSGCVHLGSISETLYAVHPRMTIAVLLIFLGIGILFLVVKDAKPLNI